MPQRRDPYPQPRPPGRAGHAVQPRLLSQSHLHADPRVDHHRQVSEPARRLLAGHQAARVGTHDRRGPASGRRTHRTGRQGALPAAGRQRGIPFAGSVPDAAGSRFLETVPRTVLRVRARRAGPQSHRRGARRPALRALDGAQRARQLARLLPSTHRHQRPPGAHLADPGAIPLRHLDRRALLRSAGRLCRARGAVLPMGELLRSAPQVPGPGAVGPDVRPRRRDRAGAGAGASTTPTRRTSGSRRRPTRTSRRGARAARACTGSPRTCTTAPSWPGTSPAITGW